jgi:hypothetical protein
MVKVWFVVMAFCGLKWIKIVIHIICAHLLEKITYVDLARILKLFFGKVFGRKNVTHVKLVPEAGRNRHLQTKLVFAIRRRYFYNVR